MVIKALIWDFDGVIVSTGKIHFNALNKALTTINPDYCVSEKEDLFLLGTKTTKEKLKIISKIKNIPEEYYEKILNLKKKYTLDVISNLDIKEYYLNKIGDIINKLRQDGYLIYLASNTNREFIDLILNKINIKFDNILCGDDVSKTKPHPEIYLKSFLHAGVSPDECMIFEDSATGQEAGIKSGAHVYPVESPNDLNYDLIIKYIKSICKKSIKWQSQKINIIIPMAGEGSRFKNAGWNTPKPLIDVNGLPMVATVIRDLNIDASFTFIIKQEHDELYNLSTILKLIEPNCNIVYVSGKQTGAATTILQAQHLIDNNKHLLIVNSDQMWSWKSNIFYNSITRINIDGSIVVFEDKSRNPKWSFAKLDEQGYVSEVVEKQPISDLATGGIYYWSLGSDFVKYAKQMVEENFTVNGEYYVAPVYNFAIRDGKKFSTFMIDEFWPTGTPEELEFYLKYRID